MLQLGDALQAEQVSDVWSQQQEQEEDAGVQENINNNNNYNNNYNDNYNNDRIQENQIPPVQPPPNSHYSPAPEQQQQAPKWHPSMVRIPTQSRDTFQSIKPQHNTLPTWSCLLFFYPSFYVCSVWCVVVQPSMVGMCNDSLNLKLMMTLRLILHGGSCGWRPWTGRCPATWRGSIASTTPATER